LSAVRRFKVLSNIVVPFHGRWLARPPRPRTRHPPTTRSLPPAATIYVLATQYDTYVLRASSAILLGTAASVFTVTGVLYLIAHDLLPFWLVGA
jgi:hypothetical protein